MPWRRGVALCRNHLPDAGGGAKRCVASPPSGRTCSSGAGTVLTTEQAARARDAGARFIVSPGINPKVVEWCQDHSLPVFPGVCTPTEIETALECGLNVVKFFPAEPSGGARLISRRSRLRFPTWRFMPTGGITAANVREYLAFKRVVACGGSWMAPQDWIAQGAFDRIREAVAATVSAVS